MSNVNQQTLAPHKELIERIIDLYRTPGGLIQWSKAAKEHPEWFEQLGVDLKDRDGDMSQVYHFATQITRAKFPEEFEKRSEERKKNFKNRGARGPYKKKRDFTPQKETLVKARAAMARKRAEEGLRRLEEHHSLPPAAVSGPEPSASGMFCPKCTALIESIAGLAALLKGGKGKQSIVPFSNMLPQNE
jgi:hypothetical protein